MLRPTYGEGGQVLACSVTINYIPTQIECPGFLFSSITVLPL